jgi:hypothetical protein
VIVRKVQAQIDEILDQSVAVACEVLEDHDHNEENGIDT